MDISRKLMWSVYVGVIGTVTTIAAEKAVKGLWKVATGENPPDPTDPNAPFSEAAIWAAASALGVGTAQLAARRFAAKRWNANMMSPIDSLPKLSVNVK